MNVTAIDVARSYPLEGGKNKLRGEVAFKCPFDEKKRFKLYVNQESDVWHCQHCKQGGKAGFSLAAFLLGLQWPHDAKEIQFWLQKCTSALDRIDTGKLVKSIKTKKVVVQNPTIKINRVGPTLISNCYKILTPIPIAQKIGRNKADILERFQYWAYYHHKPEIRQTITQLCSQLPWISERQMKREIAELESGEFLISRKQGRDKYYRVNHDRLQTLFHAETHSISNTDNSSPSSLGATVTPYECQIGTYQVCGPASVRLQDLDPQKTK